MGQWGVRKSGETRVQDGKGGPTMSNVTKVQIGGVVKGVSWIQVFIINFFKFTYLFGCAGSWSWHAVSSDSTTAYGIFSCGMGDLVPW